MLARLPAVLSALLLTGCVRSIVLYADPELAHEEAVSRLTKLFKEEAVLDGEMASGSERKLSATRTQVIYDRTVFEFNTSDRGYVRVSFKSYRPGSFLDERLPESEAAIAKRLVSIRKRADDALLRPSAPPSSTR
jgi:hypothetical protein